MLSLPHVERQQQSSENTVEIGAEWTIKSR